MIVHTFKQDEILQEMLHLRKRGWTYKSLASLYGVDHSSIYHWCKKFNVECPVPIVSIDIKDIIALTQPNLVSILSVVFKPKPMSYSDYLKQSHV